MKHRLWLLGTLLLCLLLLPLSPAAAAEDAGQTHLLITDAAYDPATGLLSVSWTNSGTDSVTGAELRAVPRDTEGNLLVVGEGYIEDILLEQRVYHSFTSTAPGESASAVFAAGALYPDASWFEVAFDAVTMESGVTLELPENRLCWYSTRENAYVTMPESGEPYALPDADVLARASGYRLGFTAIAVTDDLAAAYGFYHSGMMIAEIRPDSLAEAIGLLPGDLIFAVNDIRYAGEPYIVSLAAAALADSQPVTLWIERENTAVSLFLEP